MVRNSNDISLFLQTHKGELAQRFGVESIGLFGSYARGEERDDSDIAIEMRPEHKSLRSFMGLRCYLEQEFGKPVDLEIESALKPQAKELVAKDIIQVWTLKPALLSDILEAGVAIQSYVADIDFATFRRGRMRYPEVIREFEIIGEAVGNCPPS